jgi:hypothetical protein
MAMREGMGRTGPSSLAVAAQMWPTPTASEHTGPGHSEKAGGKNLRTVVAEREMWPTPTANLRDMDTMERARLSGQQREAMRESGEPYQTQTTGSLNPTWVEWLMGFPLGWTDLGA